MRIALLLPGLSSTVKMEQADALEKWQKMYFPRELVRMKITPYGQLGVFAERDIPRGSILLDIEYEDQITVKKAIRELKTKVKLKVPTLDCVDTLILYIYYELKKEEESELFPFFDAITKDFSYILANWDEKYDEFLSPQVLRMKQKAQELMKIRYERARKVDPEIEFNDFNFAANLVMSRQLSDALPDPSSRPVWFLESSNCHKLAPIYDVWNHETTPNSHYFNPPGSSLTIYAARDLKKDEELFVTYGPHTHQNLMLLAIYGMALESAKGEILFFSKEEIDAALPERFVSMSKDGPQSLLHGKPSDDYLTAECEINMEKLRSSDPNLFFVKDLLNQRRADLELKLARFEKFDEPDEYRRFLVTRLIESELTVIKRCFQQFNRLSYFKPEL